MQERKVLMGHPFDRNLPDALDESISGRPGETFGVNGLQSLSVGGTARL